MSLGEKIIPINIEEEMKSKYIDYSMSVIVSRALEEIIEEVATTRVTERGGRADDKRSEAAMEDRKKEGYF